MSENVPFSQQHNIPRDIVYCRLAVFEEGRGVWWIYPQSIQYNDYIYNSSRFKKS